MPDLRAFKEEAALPSEDVGPVDFWELRRLALICACDVMIDLLGRDTRKACRGPS
jgi:hypothetical protein